MASSRKGFDAFIEKLRQRMGANKKEALLAAEIFLSCLEGTLVENIESDGFAIKLGKLCKLSIHHRPSGVRKIPVTKEIRLVGRRRKVRFSALGTLRRMERVEEETGDYQTLDPGKYIIGVDPAVPGSEHSVTMLCNSEGEVLVVEKLDSPINNT